MEITSVMRRQRNLGERVCGGGGGEAHRDSGNKGDAKKKKEAST